MRITGIPADRISRNTNSQPVSTTGEKAITSTRWVTKERNVATCFSWLWRASSRRSSMPASRAALRMDSVLAAFQLASATIWLKPSTNCGLPSAPQSPGPSEQPTSSESSASSAKEVFCRTRSPISTEAYALMRSRTFIVDPVGEEPADRIRARLVDRLVRQRAQQRVAPRAANTSRNSG